MASPKNEVIMGDRRIIVEGYSIIHAVICIISYMHLVV